MSWFAAILVITIGYAIYTMIINREFLRCPHCGKIGSWRFESIGDSDNEYDEDGASVRSTSKQRCKGCQGKVLQVWSDSEGREIRLASESEQT
jgi:DNA-directed RNA polymerase subunit RPC12/RpoP